MTLTPGIYSDISPELYHNDALTPEPSLSRSGIHALLTETPALFMANNPRLTQWPEQIDRDGTDATDLGEIVHAMVLGVGAKFIASHPSEHGFVKSGPNKGQPYSTWTGDAGAWKKQQEAAGNIVIDYDTNAKALQIAAKLTAALRERFGRAWDQRRVEQTIVWKRVLNDHCSDAPECDHCGTCWIWCRARTDANLPDGTIVDVKTSALSLSDAELGKRIALDGLDIQHCWYQDGQDEALGCASGCGCGDWTNYHEGSCSPYGRRPFIFAWVSTRLPYTVRFVDLESDEVNWPLGATRMAIDLAAHRFGAGLKTGTWPDYPIIARPIAPQWWVERRGIMLLEAGILGEEDL